PLVAFDQRTPSPEVATLRTRDRELVELRESLIGGIGASHGSRWVHSRGCTPPARHLFRRKFTPQSSLRCLLREGKGNLGVRHPKSPQFAQSRPRAARGARTDPHSMVGPR